MLVLALAASGCGKTLKESQVKKQIIVLAASPLASPLPKFEPGARYEFGRSEKLAKRIRSGEKPSVFVAENTKLPQGLAQAGKAGQPVPFATDEITIVVARDSNGKVKVASVKDLAKPGVKILAARPGTPLGGYTKQLLAKLPAGRAKRVQANMKRTATGPGEVLAKVVGGKADAGIVYHSDVLAARGKARGIPLPSGDVVKATFAAVTIKKAPHSANAAAYVERLRGSTAARVLRQAGFEPLR